MRDENLLHHFLSVGDKPVTVPACSLSVIVSSLTTGPGLCGGGGLKGWNGQNLESSCFLAVGLTIDPCSSQLTEHYMGPWSGVGK